MNRYYRFYAIDYLNNITVTLQYIIEPSPLDYIMSWLGFTGEVDFKSYLVKFIRVNGAWIEVLSSIPCSVEMCEALNGTIKQVELNPMTNIIILV